MGTNIDEPKRRFLIGATSVVGGVGALAAATPFVMSLFPSAREEAAGAPVQQDIAKVEPGQQITVECRGQPVWILNRTKPMLQTLLKLDNQLVDPNSEVDHQPPYARTNTGRSSRRFLSPSASAPTSAACRPTVPKSRRRTSVSSGLAVTSVRATSQGST